MPEHRKPADRLAELQTKRTQLDARIEALSARDATRQRKDDDRRRMLLGSMLLDKLASGDACTQAYVRARADSFLETNHDRALFTKLLDMENTK